MKPSSESSNSRRSEMLGDSAWVEQGNVVYNTD